MDQRRAEVGLWVPSGTNTGGRLGQEGRCPYKSHKSCTVIILNSSLIPTFSHSK